MLSEEKKKKMYYYYGGKEKKAERVKKEAQEIAPYASNAIQRDFDRMMERFQREFDDFWEAPARWSRSFPLFPFEEPMMPSLDLEDRGKDFRLAVDLPGFTKEDVDIEVSEDSVSIQAKKMQSEEEKKKNYVRKERRSQTFYRRVALPEAVQSDNAKASLKNGTLEVVLPKKQPKETKKLTVT